MFNNKEFNAKLSVKLTNLVKTGGNATILKQLINGVQNAVTVGLKNDVGVINAVNTKYASGNPEAFLKLAQGDSLALLSRGYKTIANGKNLSKLLVEEIASTKLELVKASALYALAKGDKGAAAGIIAAITAYKEVEEMLKAAAAEAEANADANADASADANADASADANADASADANADASADANADVLRLNIINSLTTSDLITIIETQDNESLLAIQAMINKTLKARKARKAA